MATSRSDAVKEWGPIIGPGLIWGCSYLFIAEGLTAMRPAGITFLRTMIGFVVLGLIPAARKPIQKADRRNVALLGLIWLAAPMSMFPFAEQHVSSAVTGLLNGAGPMFIAIVAAGKVRTLPNRNVLIALGIGLLGTVLIAIPSLTEGRSEAWGVALIILAMVFYGFAVNLSRPLQQRNGALPVLWRSVGVAAVLTAPTGVSPLIDAHWNRNALLSMIALGALGTGIANVLVATAAGRSNATRAGAMGFIIPSVSLVLGIVIRHEVVRPVSILGGAICLVGAWLLATSATRSESRTRT